MKTDKHTKFSISPNSVPHGENGVTATCVSYKPYRGNAYIEEEHGWFEELGAKCSLQKTKKNSIAAKGHIHDAIEILYIKQGGFMVYINDLRYEAKAGDMVLFHSGDLHRSYSSSEEENSYYVIKIHPSLVFDVSDKKNGAAYMLRFYLGDKNAKRIWTKSELADTPVEKTVLSLASECRERQPFFDIAVKKYAAELLLFILRNSTDVLDGSDKKQSADDSNKFELIYKAINFINNNYQKDISAFDVASSVGMSYGDFSRSFGSISGQSFKERLNAVRIKHAEELLITTESSVEEIASKCGYSGASYFIMLFKKIKGITPHAYRASLKQKGGE